MSDSINSGSNILDEMNMATIKVQEKKIKQRDVALSASIYLNKNLISQLTEKDKLIAELREGLREANKGWEDCMDSVDFYDIHSKIHKKFLDKYSHLLEDSVVKKLRGGE